MKLMTRMFSMNYVQRSLAHDRKANRDMDIISLPACDGVITSNDAKEGRIKFISYKT